MTDQLTESGLSIDSSSVRLDRLHANLRASIDPLQQFGVNTPTGQLTRILNDHTQRNAELLQALATAFDPDTATGVIQTAQATLTGTHRKAATQGTVEIEVTLDGGYTIPAGSLAWSDGVDDTTVSTDIDVVAPAGPSDKYLVQATVEAYGSIEIPALTIDTIKTPVTGWTGVANLADAIAGDNAETDEELRERREAGVTGSGSSSAKQVKTALSRLEGMDQVIVLENDISISQDGMPPNSIEAVVRAPSVSDAILADTIYNAKASGIQAWGKTIVDYYDIENNLHKIGFTRADEQEIDLEYTLEIGSDFPGEDDFKLAIATWADSNLGIGDDVIASRMLALAFCEVQGVESVTSFRLRFTGDGWGTADLEIDAREIADVDTSRITVIIP